MIFQFRSREDGNDEYVVSLRAPLTVAEVRDQMLLRAGVSEGTYAHRLVSDLHAAIFVRSLNLKTDYHTYFEREYGSFRDYLRRRVRLPAQVVARLEEVHESCSGLYHYRQPLYFLAEEYGLEFLTRVLEDSAAEEAP